MMPKPEHVSFPKPPKAPGISVAANYSQSYTSLKPRYTERGCVYVLLPERTIYKKVAEYDAVFSKFVDLSVLDFDHS
jgi:hypothetical protein